MKIAYTFLSVLFLTILFNKAGKAQLFTEDFSYTVGTVLTSNGWTAHSGAGTNAITVSTTGGTSGLTYSSYASSGVGLSVTLTTSGEDDNRLLSSTVSSGNVYYSAMINVATATTTGDYFLHLGTGSTTFNARLWVKSSGTGFKFGISRTSTVANVSFTSTEYAFNTTYLVAVKYTFDATNPDPVSLFINPVPGGSEPGTADLTADALDLGDIASITAIYLRQGSATLAPKVTVDGIRVATTWTEVTPAAGGTTFSITGVLTPFSQTSAPPSAEQTYTIIGSNLTNVVTVTPPAGYEISKTTESGFINSSGSLSFTAADLVTSKTIYVRLNASTPGFYSGSISHSSVDFTTVNEAVTGSMDNGRVLSLTALIEGLYNGTSMVSDTVTVELHNTTSPYSFVDSKKGVLNTTGVGTFNFTTAVNGISYYIVVKHRNAIETWSAAGNTFTSSALSYNFTTAATQAYGSNMVLKGGKYCFYSGDVNQDNHVNLQDLIAIDNDNTNIAIGYQITDLNGDNHVNLQDLIIVDNNNTAIVKRLAPSGIPPPSNVNLTMGNPSGATTDINFPHNYLLNKLQFCASYDRDKGIPSWTSWQLNAAWLVDNSTRLDNYIPDPSLPSAWYHVNDGDYSGSGFSRGHMCPSADRVNTQANNDSLFYYTNMVPQNQNNNAGAWEGLENYERTLVGAGNVVYIISGGYGAGGTKTDNSATVTTISNGHVTVPAKLWKVMIVIPNGAGDDVSRVTTSTRTIAMLIPNDSTPNSMTAWGNYRVSVDSVEALTTYDFFSNVSTSIQAVIEANTDTGPTN